MVVATIPIFVHVFMFIVPVWIPIRICSRSAPGASDIWQDLRRIITDRNGEAQRLCNINQIIAVTRAFVPDGLERCERPIPQFHMKSKASSAFTHSSFHHKNSPSHHSTVGSRAGAAGGATERKRK
jgi:hypothetical protein